VGYVVLSTDVTDTPAYSGKPVITLIGLDPQGNFAGTKILKHSEPILLLGIPESALTKFSTSTWASSSAPTSRSAARDEEGHHRPRRDLRRHRHRHRAEPGDDASGAGGGAPGRHPRKDRAPEPPRFIDRAPQARLGDSLVKEGSVGTLVVMPEQVGLPSGADALHRPVVRLSQPARGRPRDLGEKPAYAPDGAPQGRRDTRCS
jgi:NosR/NirI family nitrous oxide reductase transcriptional regulator